MSSSTNRSVTLDVAKGLAIVLVVFSHAFETYTGKWSAISGVWYWASIHHFYMALFIFVSGYLAFGKLNSPWLGRRAIQLTIPFIIWSIILYYWSGFSFSGLEGIYPLRDGVFKNLAYSAWTLNLSGLWFLPLVLGLCVLTFLTRGKLWALIAVTVVAYALSQVPLPFNQLGLPRTDWFAMIAWFMPFFVGGYLIAQYHDKLKRLSFLKWVALAAFPVFFVLGGDLNYESQAFSWPAYTTFLSADIGTGLYSFLMSALGIGMSFGIVEILRRIIGVRQALVYLGGITLGIYCIHGMWRSIGFGEGAVALASMTLTALVLSSALVWILQRSRSTDYLFLGNVRGRAGAGRAWWQGLIPLRRLKGSRAADGLEPTA